MARLVHKLSRSCRKLEIETKERSSEKRRQKMLNTQINKWGNDKGARVSTEQKETEGVFSKG